jgi:hypothetical protein
MIIPVLRHSLQAIGAVSPHYLGSRERVYGLSLSRAAWA